MASLEHRSQDKEPQMVLVWILHIPTHQRHGHQGSAVGMQNSVVLTKATADLSSGYLIKIYIQNNVKKATLEGGTMFHEL